VDRCLEHRHLIHDAHCAHRPRPGSVRLDASSQAPQSASANWIGKLERGIIRWPGKLYREAL
jgi:hypothetical protein